MSNLVKATIAVIILLLLWGGTFYFRLLFGSHHSRRLGWTGQKIERNQIWQQELSFAAKRVFHAIVTPESQVPLSAPTGSNGSCQIKA